jgi:tricorn protease
MRTLAVALLCLAPAGTSAAPLLLQHPSLSRDAIAFDFAGEIWTVPREGGTARRLVAGQGRNTSPIFSPDGALIAYTGNHDGTPTSRPCLRRADSRRAHASSRARRGRGLVSDGKSVLFNSGRRTYRDLRQLYTVPLGGGFPTELPLPSGDEASYSADGTKLAYVPYFQWQPAWKRYRGGQTTPVWIADLRDSRVTKVPREGSNDKNPMWLARRPISSDRAGR